MPYWGSEPVDNDYAFTTVGAYVSLIKERMFKGADTVIEKAHPEQGIVASLQCLRLLASQFRKNVLVHFGKQDFEKAKDAFGRWYDTVQTQLPAKYRDAIRISAQAEFELFESQVLTPS